MTINKMEQYTRGISVWIHVVVDSNKDESYYKSKVLVINQLDGSSELAKRISTLLIKWAFVTYRKSTDLCSEICLKSTKFEVLNIRQKHSDRDNGGSHCEKMQRF